MPLPERFNRRWWCVHTCLVLCASWRVGVGEATADERLPWQPPEYEVERVAERLVIDGKLDEPSWMGARAVAGFQFPWWKSGHREQSVAKLLWDDRCLYVACVCQDRHITARTKERDGPVAQDDCFEIMLLPNPERPEVYFNIEWNVIGGILDNHRPHGPSKPRAPKWDAVGIEIAGTYLGTLNQDADVDQFWVVEVAIPFANFREFAPATPPSVGSRWHANLNRHGGVTNPQFSQWSAGDTPTPSFHTPHRFGRLVFSGDTVPTGQARRVAVPPEEAVARMTLPAGVMATPFAAEPNIRQPNLVKVDDRGRLWVIQYLQYPNPAGLERVQVDRWSRTTYDRVPEPPPRGPRGADRITICEDTDQDGRADRFRDFVDGLNLSTGLAFGHGGVYVLQVPYLLFYPDRNRDDVPDSDPEVLLSGFGMEDAQSFVNHLTWGPDGWLYGVNGSTTTCRVRDLEFQQGVWRYHPTSKAFELFCEGGGNLFGLTFDEHGQMFFTSNGGHLCMHGLPGAYYQKAFNKHGPLHHPYAYGYFAEIEKLTPVVGGPCTGGTIYLGDGLPASFRGAFLCGDFLGHSSSWWRLSAKGASYTATRGGALLTANDPWFGATDVAVGPDGAVYVCDFHDKRTAHPDPDANWDRDTGRVYRLTSMDLLPRSITDLRTASNAELLSGLGDANGWLRERARVLLSERRDPALYAQLRQRVFAADSAPLALAALWTLHGSGGLDLATVLRLLEHDHEHLRIWGIRLIGESSELAEHCGDQLAERARVEPHPLVRAELAAVSRRLPISAAWNVLQALIDRDLDANDTHLPWLVWWGVERTVAQRFEPARRYFQDARGWENHLASRMLPLVLRRTAADGSRDLDSLALLQATPNKQQLPMLSALITGLRERAPQSPAIGQGDLFRTSSQSAAPESSASNARRGAVEVSRELREYVASVWQRTPNHPELLRAALTVSVPESYSTLLARADDGELAESEQLATLSLLAEFGRADAVAVVAKRLETSRSEAVQLGAIRALDRLGDSAGPAKWLAALPSLPESVQQAFWTSWLGRPQSAAVALEEVDRGRVPAAKVPLPALRLVATHGDPRLDALVQKHWGRIQSGTPEEKLAVMRRLNNDLRAAPGDPQAGKQLFQKHCAVCHQLFGSGEKIGPDLTNTSRKDLEFLLANLVDPSAVVKREFMASTLALDDGRVLTGLIVADSGGELTLVDSQGKKQQIEKRLITVDKPAETSLMPEGLLLQLQPQELRDLIRYLQSDP